MKFQQTRPSTKKSKGTNTCDYVLLHHTGGSSRAGAKSVLFGSKQASWHYTIDVGGEMYKYGEDTDILWHAGTSEWQGKTSLNKYSIGIEIVSDGYTFTDAQKRAVKDLVRYLMKKHNIPADNIIRHKDVSPGRKRDPGDNLWQNEYVTYDLYQQSFMKGPYDDLWEDLVKNEGAIAFLTVDSSFLDNDIRILINIALHNFRKYMVEYINSTSIGAKLRKLIKKSS